MTESQHRWSQNWAERVVNKAQALGYANVSELLADMLGEPYGNVARRLGDVAPIQVLSVQFSEAKLAGHLREAAMDSLVRNLVELLPNGWGTGENSEFQAAHALASWSSEIQVTAGFVELEPLLLAIGDALWELPPPRGWIPTGPSDPVIQSVFDACWS